MRIKRLVPVGLFLSLVGYGILSMAVESGMCRLLSISESEKLILVSQIPSKTKLLLDVSSAKITVDGKPAEIKDLKSYSVVQVKANLRKTSKYGITIDGSVTEIRISTPGTIR